MKVYIVCPYFTTGGPEAMHQLCHEINSLGYEGYIVYLNKKNQKELLYKNDYALIQEANTIEDAKENVMIYPEIYTAEILKKYYKLSNIRMAVWWLSFNNAISFNSLEANVYNKDLVHLFQSQYAKEAILKNIDAEQKTFELHDYTKEMYINQYNKKEDKICDNKIAYNPTKDIIFPQYLVKWDYLSLPLVDLTPNLMLHKLKTCKIYVDLGAHPGKDRIPREAAMAGCVVITNKLGAADNEIDISIEEKVDGPEELKVLIEDIFKNYESYYEKQKNYREVILSEKNVFKTQVQGLLEYFSNNDK
jgi:hypothetical protein